jgi:hypothetical protein
LESGEVFAAHRVERPGLRVVVSNEIIENVEHKPTTLKVVRSAKVLPSRGNRTPTALFVLPAFGEDAWHTIGEHHTKTRQRQGMAKAWFF